MGTIILMIIGFASLGHIAADFLNQFEKLWEKPFKCNACLTYWLSFIPFIFIYGWVGVLYAATASIVSEIIYRQLT